MSLDTQISTNAWIIQHMEVVLASLAKKGVIPKEDAARHVSALHETKITLGWLQRNEDAIRQAITGGSSGPQRT